MADIFTVKKRSEIMSRIKGRGNAATEMRLIQLFKKHGITGWRRNFPLFGKPDFVFPKQRVAIFVDGEFWHGHPTRGSVPKTNTAFWEAKIQRNKARDRLVTRTLKGKNWTVIRIWQKDLSKVKTLSRILNALSG